MSACPGQGGTGTPAGWQQVPRHTCYHCCLMPWLWLMPLNWGKGGTAVLPGSCVSCYHHPCPQGVRLLSCCSWICGPRWVPSLILGTWGQQGQMMVRIHLWHSGRREHLCSSDVPHCSISSIKIPSLIAIAVKKKNRSYFFLHICSFCFYSFPQPFLSPSLLTVSREFLVIFISSHAKLVSPSHHLSELRHSLI